jgi:hypothetical protein
LYVNQVRFSEAGGRERALDIAEYAPDLGLKIYPGGLAIRSEFDPGPDVGFRVSATLARDKHQRTNGPGVGISGKGARQFILIQRHG